MPEALTERVEITLILRISAQNIPFAGLTAYPARKFQFHQDTQQHRRRQAAEGTQLLHAPGLCPDAGQNFPLPVIHGSRRTAGCRWLRRIPAQAKDPEQVFSAADGTGTAIPEEAVRPV